MLSGMNSATLYRFGLFALVAAAAAPPFAIADETSLFAEAEREPAEFAPDDLKFFEERIRPVLVKSCYECHSAAAVQRKRLKGGLRVDSRAGLLRGGDSGPAMIENDADQSLLIRALRYDSLEMPPQGKLPANVIADFERWISRGAADPRTEEAKPQALTAIDLETGRRHWAYQPLRAPALPAHDSRTAVSRAPLDEFVLAKLQSEGLEAAAEADRTTLIRRVSFDLVGLPPAPEEIAEFLSDETPDAWERLVDRLLASPRFGERWGRHWLSVVRFGESLTLRGFVQPEAWRYRDYVIESFNAGRPFDRMIVEQIAGDLLDAESLADRQRQLIATTFLTLGNLNLEEQDKQQLRMDAVDEQLEAIGKGFLAQTIGCARCHDHKFDPIPTRDYYALAGILANVKTLEHANVSRWLEFPLPVEPEQEAVYANHEAAAAALAAKIKSVQESLQKKKSPTVIAAKDLPGVVVDDRQAKIVGEWQASQHVTPFLGDGYIHDKDAGKGDKTVTFLPELPHAGLYEVRLAYTAGDNRSSAVPVTVFSADGEKTVMVNQRERPSIDGLFVSLGQYRFELNGQGFVIVSTADTQGHVIVDAVQFLPVAAPDTKTKKADPPATPDADESARLTRELQTLQQQMKELQASGPRRPKYMSVQEEKQFGDIRVHIRGTVHNLGETVPRGFLQVATSGESSLSAAANSGRKELGEWIASRSNPLTPRVLANRVWQWLFGAGLSRTPENFGTTGEEPSHSELLDHLAVRLLDRDWSVKPLIREIVQSRSYRQSSVVTKDQKSRDPENRWLSHQNRRRLDAECLLDAILTVSGKRNDALGGSEIQPGTAEDYGFVHRSTRRAVYWPVFRNALPPIFEAFDFADPSLPAGSRNVSTVAPQALFFLNEEGIAAAARSAAERLLAEPLADDSARADRVFLLTLGRRPTAPELQIADDALSLGHSPVEAWAMIVRALFASIDFRYME